MNCLDLLKTAEMLLHDIRTSKRMRGQVKYFSCRDAEYFMNMNN